MIRAALSGNSHAGASFSKSQYSMSPVASGFVFVDCHDVRHVVLHHGYDHIRAHRSILSLRVDDTAVLQVICSWLLPSAAPSLMSFKSNFDVGYIAGALDLHP